MNKLSIRLRLATIGAIACIAGLPAGTAQAVEVIKDGDTATGITDLTIGSKTYDVTFTCFVSTADTYPPPPPIDFDFDTQESAGEATDAIITAFNADGGVLAVGCGTEQGEFSQYAFRLAYRLEELDELPAPGFGKLDATVLLVTQGARPSEEFPALWSRWDSDAADQLFVYGDDSVVALFTETSGGGAGNSPPVAYAGGPYTGTAGEPVDFDASGSSDSDGNIVSWDWQFGDGGMASGETPGYTYGAAGTYNVTLTVTDNDGAKKSDSAQATIGAAGEPPTADAGGPYTGSAGSAVKMDGSGSSDPDGNIASYSWDFGDNSPAGSGIKPSHEYAQPGKYTVELTVTDDTGETDTSTTEANIGSGNLPPTSDAGGPYIGAAGVAKEFDGTGSSDPDGDTLTYSWNFGDGNVGTGAKPTHTYANPGSYTATLTVTDDDNASDSSGTTVVMGDGNPPVADRLVDLVTLDDVGGSAGADLAVLDVALANGDQLSATVHVHDGSTGNQLYSVDVSDSWRSIAIDTAMANAGPRLAILQRDATGDLRVRVLDATNGAQVSTIAYFDNTWTPIDILNVRDAGGPGIEGIGVLAENPAGQQAIEVHTVSNGALVNQVLYFNDAWKASSAIDLGEFNGNGVSEMAVLATNNAGKHAVETRDALSAKQISRYFFLGPTNTVIGLADVADVDGNGRPENVVLGNKDATDNTANTIQAKDVKSDALISKVGTYGPDFTGFGIRSIGDVDGNSFQEVVVAVLNNTDNTTSVSVRDIAGSSLTRKTGFLGPAYDPRDVEVLGDVSGNGIQEVVVAGLNGETLVIRVQLRDALDGTLLRNIDIN